MRRRPTRPPDWSSAVPWLAVAFVFVILLLLFTCRAVLAEELAHPPEVMTPRQARVWALILDAAYRYDVNPLVLWTVIHKEAGPGLDYAARGDLGHSRGLAQINDRPTGLQWHFTALGYTDPDDPVQAIDYLGQAFGGFFACSEGIGPWRWTGWRTLDRVWVHRC